MPIAPAPLLLANVFIPLWMLAGVLDWACHRRSGIEATSGMSEALIHHLLFLELGIPLLLLALFQASTGLLLLAISFWLLHEITVWRELIMVQDRRAISAFEQQVHGALEMLPLAALALVVVEDWPLQPGWFHRRDEPAFNSATGAALTLGMAAVWALYCEELYRCWRNRGGAAGRIGGFTA